MAVSKKKYKPVALKVRPVITDLPDRFRIIRNITGDPLKDMPKLNPHPPTFSPTTRYSLERKAIIDKNHPGNFLWLEERNLMHDFIRNQEAGFAWSENEQGSFRPDFFPPIEFPVIPHTPWVECNIPIPPGIYPDVCDMLKKKLEAGVYEPSIHHIALDGFASRRKMAKRFELFTDSNSSTKLPSNTQVSFLSPNT